MSHGEIRLGKGLMEFLHVNFNRIVFFFFITFSNLSVFSKVCHTCICAVCHALCFSWWWVNETINTSPTINVSGEQTVNQSLTYDSSIVIRFSDVGDIDCSTFFFLNLLFFLLPWTLQNAQSECSVFYINVPSQNVVSMIRGSYLATNE